MNCAFIGGIPASGKSYLAKKISKSVGGVYIGIDQWRDEMESDPYLEKWVNFFWNQDENKYWENTSCIQQWENLKNQSEAFWPIVLKKIKETQKTKEKVIFEGVNIMPQLAFRDLNFKGVFLLGGSIEEIFERNKKEPRWGKTEELQRKEAEAFYNCEGMMYKLEAEKYGFKTFDNSIDAEVELFKILNGFDKK